MSVPENNDLASCELSLEELDAVAGGGLWGWIKHEASSAWDWLKHDGLKVAEAIIKVITHPPTGPGPGPTQPPHRMS